MQVVQQFFPLLRKAGLRETQKLVSILDAELRPGTRSAEVHESRSDARRRAKRARREAQHDLRLGVELRGHRKVAEVARPGPRHQPLRDFGWMITWIPARRAASGKSRWRIGEVM